jgi:hypothetical protein
MRSVSLLAAFVALTVVAVGAGEKGAAAGASSPLGPAILESRLPMEDVAGHEIQQGGMFEQLSTPDRINGVSFDGARVRTIIQADVVENAGVVRGYSSWEARSGEKLYLAFGYTVPPKAPGAETSRFEGTFEWRGGTGAVSGLRGKGTIEGEVNAQGERRYRWAGSYELGAK